MHYIDLDPIAMQSEHICCAFSDKKCQDSYAAKKQWLCEQFVQGYVFRRLDERAKVFIEYGPAEHAWLPITAPDYLALGCFWVSGKYKQHGHGKALLQHAIAAAKQQHKLGLLAVVGKKKYHFMSDGKWLLKQGFKMVDESPQGFVLLALQLQPGSHHIQFKPRVKKPTIDPQGCVAYYSHRCPYAAYHVQQSLADSCKKRGIPLTIVHLQNTQQAQQSPTPATIFSLYYQGAFITTDLSACMDTRFDKFITPQ